MFDRKCGVIGESTQRIDNLMKEANVPNRIEKTSMPHRLTAISAVEENVAVNTILRPIVPCCVRTTIA
jgi:hypothetical protein